MILVTCFVFGSQQVNIRAFYKALYGIASDKTNDILYCLGFLSCISLPLIGVFDEKDYKLEHGLSAIVFFLSCCAYIFWLARVMQKYKAQFSASA
jgi:hypothetical membrane protein